MQTTHNTLTDYTRCGTLLCRQTSWWLNHDDQAAVIIAGILRVLFTDNESNFCVSWGHHPALTADICTCMWPMENRKEMWRPAKHTTELKKMAHCTDSNSWIWMYDYVNHQISVPKFRLASYDEPMDMAVSYIMQMTCTRCRTLPNRTLCWKSYKHTCHRIAASINKDKRLFQITSVLSSSTTKNNCQR